jgi:DNA invertase Pin-like site-specific DNA recombinase
MTKCFVYLRVSGKSQIRGDGFLRQFRACRAYAKEHNLQIVRMFREKGVSGTKELEDRPALTDLFAALEDDGVKIVVIEKLDRMARDLMIQETIIQDMQKNSYMLASTCEPDLNSEEPSRILIRQIFGALAQWDRAMIVLKLRGARQRMKARGTRCEGRKPYAEDPNRPSEAPVLDRMLQLQSEGLNAEHIARALNGEGILTRYGKLWLSPTISRILARQKKTEKAA